MSSGGHRFVVALNLIVDSCSSSAATSGLTHTLTLAGREEPTPNTFLPGSSSTSYSTASCWTPSCSKAASTASSTVGASWTHSRFICSRHLSVSGEQELLPALLLRLGRLLLDYLIVGVGPLHRSHHDLLLRDAPD